MIPKIKRLWKASKIYGVPITDPMLSELNIYDLIFIDYLTYFENPENEHAFKNTYFDDEFNEYFNSQEYIPAIPVNDNGIDKWEELKVEDE